MTQEATTLSKMAVSVLLCILLLGAIVSFFFLSYTKSNQYIEKMQDATTTYTAERLYELSDASLSAQSSEDLPLCTAVMSVLQNFEPDDLLYIELKASPSAATSTIWKYENLDVDVNATAVQNPIKECCKVLRRNSDKHAKVSLVPYTYDGTTNLFRPAPSDVNYSFGDYMLAIKITLYEVNRY